MKQVSVYDIIKKQNGEHFAKAIRNYNNGIFEIPNIVNIVKYAGTEAEPIMNYLVSLMDIQINETEYEDPFALLKKAGYNAYYADTLEKQNAISKYFEEDERLCTFRDNTRFENYYIINAVKENVDDIKRKDFKRPEREDEYGTSVISIQMLKSGGFISIKNRYNHKVANPDNTFNSNPDNIIYGLSYSLKKYFDVDFSPLTNTISSGFVLIDNQLVKYYYEIDGYYVGDGFYAKNGKITEINKQTEIMMDWYILNLKNKTISSVLKKTENEDYENTANIFTNELKDKAIQIVKNEDKTKSILLDGKEFVRLHQSRMTRLTLENTTELPNNFLYQYNSLEYLNCPNVEQVGDSVLLYNHTMRYCNMINAKKFGDYFLGYNECLQEINIPNVVDIDDGFLWQNTELKELNIPKVKNIGHNCFSRNEKITSLNLPNVLHIGDSFLHNNEMLESLNLPAVLAIDNDFLKNNKALKQLNLPKVTKIGNGFLVYNNKIKSLNIPNVLYIGDDFLKINYLLESINLPSVKEIGSSCFYNNIRKILKEIYMPNIETIGYNSFFHLIYSKEIEHSYYANAAEEMLNRSKFYSDKKLIDKIKFYSQER